MVINHLRTLLHCVCYERNFAHEFAGYVIITGRAVHTLGYSLKHHAVCLYKLLLYIILLLGLIYLLFLLITY